MKARFQRALALLLVLVLTLGCIPAVSAVQPDEPVTNPEPAEEAAQLPEGSDLGAILQGNKDAEARSAAAGDPEGHRSCPRHRGARRSRPDGAERHVRRKGSDGCGPHSAAERHCGTGAGRSEDCRGRTGGFRALFLFSPAQRYCAGMRLWPYRGAGSSAGRQGRPPCADL